MTTPVLAEARGTRVLVTGATGYVAGWLIKRLLESGAIVHAAVRDPSNAGKNGHLQAMADASPGSIVFFKADLMDAGSHDEAMQGCKIVFHTASPFLLAANIHDPQRQVVDPALKGTTDIFEAANRTPSVERIVLTSSAAAMSGGPADIERAPGGILDESCWNTISSLEIGPYLYSKTVAERAAWAIAGAQDRWRLVVINPTLVLGPGTADFQTSASFDYVRMMGDGTYKDGVPPWHVGMVDVRDVAEAHYLAGFADQAEGRHLVSAETHSLGDVVEMLKDAYRDGWPFPQDTALPDAAPRWNSDNSKSKIALGLEYHPVKDAAIAMFRQLIDTGVLKPA